MSGGHAVGSEVSRRTSSALISEDADGIIVLRFDDGCQLDETAAAEVAAAHVELSAGRKHPVLADVRGMLSVERRAREVATRAGVSDVTARMALLVTSPVSRVIGSFFLRVNPPAYPARLFTDERRARAWLRET